VTIAWETRDFAVKRILDSYLASESIKRETSAVEVEEGRE